MTVSYPLQWPADFKRTPSPAPSQFKTSVTGAVKNVQDELRRFGVDSKLAVSNTVISSNVTLMDNRPKDGAVACYFRWDNMDCCIAVDKYHHPEENLQAITHIINAERTKLRHGGLNIVRASFRGFTALPPPPPNSAASIPKPWWYVLGFQNDQVTIGEAEELYRNLVKKYHPDRAGGDAIKFNQVADAIRQARELLK